MSLTVHDRTPELAEVAAESGAELSDDLFAALTVAELNALRGMLLRSVQQSGRLAVFAAGSDLWDSAHGLQHDLFELHRAACAAWSVA
ncbi:MAG: hypothetical protein ACLQDY_12830 [Streptosporangiaceae bacterium]